MKTFGFTCSSGWIGGSGVVLADNIEEALLKINNQLPKLVYGDFFPVDLDDITECTGDVILITNGDY